METIRGDIYDFPKYYDVLFGSFGNLGHGDVLVVG
jgi:hypothetical protein